MNNAAELVAKMDRFGRFTFAPLEYRGDSGEIWSGIIGPLYPIAQADPGAFVTDLARTVVPAGGWAVYGGSHAVFELLGGNFRHPAADELMDESLEFLRSRGVPNLRLTGYEHQFWVEHRGRTEQWLTGRPRPTRAAAPIADLRPGEERFLAQIFPEPDSNLVLVRRGGEGYIAVIDAKFSDDDPRRSRRDWKGARTLDDLYWDIGTTFQVPTYWHAPELGPYFPLPRPQLD